MRPTRTRTTLVGLLVAAAVAGGGATTALAAEAAGQSAAQPPGVRPQLPVAAPDPATQIAGLGALGGVTQQVQGLVASATATAPPGPAALQAQADKVKSTLDTLVATVPAPAGARGTAERPPGDLGPLPTPSVGAPVPLPSPSVSAPVPVPDPLKDAAAKLQSDVAELLDAVKSADPTKIAGAVTGIATDTLAVAVATVTGLSGTLPV